MKLVIDASVAIKWVIRDRLVEPDVDKAVAILRGVRARAIEVVAPPHWRAEVLAVVARARPQRVGLVLGTLAMLPFEEVASIDCYRRAANIAIELDHHLFDTLYHAVALEENATLVTADQTYFGKARGLGGIVPLAEFAI